jgi:hypothetical protein
MRSRIFTETGVPSKLSFAVMVMMVAAKQKPY